MDESDSNILLIDDEISIRQVVGGALKRSGYKVEVAETGRAGLDHAEQARPDLVICDIMMPGLDGFETVRLLRDIPGLDRCYVIFLSAKGEQKDVIEGFETMADDYLIKPFHMPELIARVRAGLRIKKTLDKLAIANEQLQVALNQRDDLARLIAHDLRNPIHIIHSYAGLIGKETLPLETIRDVCQRRAKEMLHLVDRAADVNLIFREKMTLDIQSVALHHIAGQLRVLYAPLLEEQGVQVHCQFDQTAMVFGDANRLHEVMDTLFATATKLVADVSQLQVSLQRNGEDVIFLIRVSPFRYEGNLQQLIQMLEGVTGWRDGVDTSVHLGMIIAQRVMELMQGELLLSQSDDQQTLSLGFVLPAPVDETKEKACMRLLGQSAAPAKE